jgi:hypothetical protein
MNKSEIVTAFERLNAELSTKGIRGEIGVVGGAAMVLGFNARSATKDVDAIFVPSENIREAAKKVAHELSLPDDWINDAVKGFLPGEPKEKRVLFGGDSLTVWVPEAEYLLAMKGISARFDTSDAADLKTLIKHLGTKTAEEALDIIQSYYPKRAIPAKTQFFIEELFGSMSEGLDRFGLPLNEGFSRKR